MTADNPIYIPPWSYPDFRGGLLVKGKQIYERENQIH